MLTVSLRQATNRHQPNSSRKQSIPLHKNKCATALEHQGTADLVSKSELGHGRLGARESYTELNNRFMSCCLSNLHLQADNKGMRQQSSMDLKGVPICPFIPRESLRCYTTSFYTSGQAWPGHGMENLKCNCKVQRNGTVPAWLTKHLHHVDSVYNSNTACNQN